LCRPAHRKWAISIAFRPDYVDKTILDGEWYFRPTIVETQYNQGQIFEGLEGSMEKIRWEVHEDALLGYRSYEAQPALDGQAGHGAEGNDVVGSNSPIIGFKIISHFDIKYQYNAATGVQTMSRKKNTTDNHGGSAATYAWTGPPVSLTIRSTSKAMSLPISLLRASTFHPSRETDPNRLRITTNYIEATVNMGMSVDLETCTSVFGDYLDWCGASEGKMRLSFLKVAPTVAYEPLEYPDYIPVQYRKMYRDSRTGTPCDPDSSTYCEEIGLCVPDSTDPFCAPTLFNLYICSRRQQLILWKH